LKTRQNRDLSRRHKFGLKRIDIVKDFRGGEKKGRKGEETFYHRKDSITVSHELISFESKKK